MLHFTDIQQAQKVCECLAAPARLEIMRLVLSKRTDSLDELAKTLHLTNGAITQHVKKLCDAGLIRLEETPGKHGVAKHCVPAVDRIIIDIATELVNENEKTFELPLGSFSSAKLAPYCGIATQTGWIGERDDPRYFTYPERINAALIYFNSGRIGWTLPSPTGRKKICGLSVSLEISSKPYGHGRMRESDITFYLGDAKLGSHTVDGEFADRKGLLTPPGFEDYCQYGKYKTVSITPDGTFFDGIKLSGFTSGDITADNFVFSLSTESGVALFGKGYGDYGCGLRCKITYA